METKRWVHYVIRKADSPSEYWRETNSVGSLSIGYWVSTPGKRTIYGRDMWADGNRLPALPDGGEWVLWSDVVADGLDEIGGR
jgi:hypothetical protein